MTDYGTTTDGTAGPGETGPGETGHSAQETERSLPRIPYGEWPSPIAAAQVAGSRLSVAFPIVIAESTWWQEDQPHSGGRTTIMRSDAGGAPAVLLPAPWAARTRVHEYGGLSYLPVPSPAADATLAAAGQASGGIPIVFANLEDQRLYLAGADVAEGKAAPVALTPDPTAVGSAAEPREAPGGGTSVAGTGAALEPPDEQRPDGERPDQHAGERECASCPQFPFASHRWNEWAGAVSIPIFPVKCGELCHLSYRPARTLGRPRRAVIGESHRPLGGSPPLASTHRAPRRLRSQEARSEKTPGTKPGEVRSCRNSPSRVSRSECAPPV